MAVGGSLEDRRATRASVADLELQLKHHNRYAPTSSPNLTSAHSLHPVHPYTHPSFVPPHASHSLTHKITTLPAPPPPLWCSLPPSSVVPPPFLPPSFIVLPPHLSSARPQLTTPPPTPPPQQQRPHPAQCVEQQQHTQPAPVAAPERPRQHRR